jgi:isoamylase
VLGNTCEHGCFNFDKMHAPTRSTASSRELPPRPRAAAPGVDLIAEPWAIGGNSYQVGGFPCGLGRVERQATATPCASDQNKLGVEPITPGHAGHALRRLLDLYGDDGRKPWNSVNFVVAHDGFTLRDLYAYNGKNNLQPWP